MMKISRRTMLKRSVGHAVIAGTAAASAHVLMQSGPRRYPADPGPHAEQDPRLIRPPGAIDEDSFLAGCIRCYRCQDACEPGAIQFFNEAHGRSYHTPHVEPSLKACTLCMKCTQVCPTHVLEPLGFEDRARVAMATVELHPDLCLSHQARRIRDEQAHLMELGRAPTTSDAPDQRRGPCGECFTFCPLRNRAIKLEPGAFLAPIVFPEHCAGCGMCEEICRVMVRGEPAIRVVPTRGGRAA